MKLTALRRLHLPEMCAGAAIALTSAVATAPAEEPLPDDRSPFVSGDYVGGLFFLLEGEIPAVLRTSTEVQFIDLGIDCDAPPCPHYQVFDAETGATVVVEEVFPGNDEVAAALGAMLYPGPFEIADAVGHVEDRDRSDYMDAPLRVLVVTELP